MLEDRRCGIFVQFSFVVGDGVSVGGNANFDGGEAFCGEFIGKEAELTGWLRRQKPWVSLTGIGGKVVSVGWGVGEKKVAMEEVIDCPKSGLDEDIN